LIEAALSVITRAEVLAGFGSEEAVTAASLLDRFPTLGIDLPVADLASEASPLLPARPLQTQKGRNGRRNP